MASFVFAAKYDNPGLPSTGINCGLDEFNELLPTLVLSYSVEGESRPYFAQRENQRPPRPTSPWHVNVCLPMSRLVSTNTRSVTGALSLIHSCKPSHFQIFHRACVHNLPNDSDISRLNCSVVQSIYPTSSITPGPCKNTAPIVEDVPICKSNGGTPERQNNHTTSERDAMLTFLECSGTVNKSHTMDTIENRRTRIWIDVNTLASQPLQDWKIAKKPKRSQVSRVAQHESQQANDFSILPTCGCIPLFPTWKQ